MIQKVFAIFDSKAEAFLPPFQQPTVGMAIRAFESAATNAQHDFCRFPGDYTLFEIGEWNQIEGLFVNLEAKVNLGTALQFQNHIGE